MTLRGARFLDWRGILGVLISVVLLFLVFRGVDFAEVVSEVRGADPLLFLLSAFLATAVFVVRAWRWGPIVEPMARTGFDARFAAVSIGFMGNNLLPARAGEFARAYALARLERITISGSFGSLVVERLFDGLAVVGFLALAMAAPGFPDVGLVGGRDVGSVGGALFLLFVAILLVLLAMVLWPRIAVGAAEKVARLLLPIAVRRPVIDALEAFLTGVEVLRRPALLLKVSLWTIGLWLLNAVGFWVGFMAFDIHLPFLAAIFLQSIISLAVSIPSAPGFFGLFEGAARAGLVGVWGVEATKAVGFAVGFHLAGFIPITLIGLFYVWRLGFSWGEVRDSEEVVELAVEEETGARASGAGAEEERAGGTGDR